MEANMKSQLALIAAAVSLFAGEATATLQPLEYYLNKGLTKSGLVAEFPQEVSCPSIDLGFAEFHEYAPIYQTHAGMDIGGRRGEPILAIADGEVLGVYEGRKGNRKVALRHSPRDTGLDRWVFEEYQHVLPKVPEGIKEGVRVKKGQVIAYMGSTGETIYTHLHVEMSVNASELYGFFSPRGAPGNRVLMVTEWIDPLIIFTGTTYIDKVIDKTVQIRYLGDGSNSKVIWPVKCK